MKTKQWLGELQPKSPKELVSLIRSKQAALIKARFDFSLGKTTKLREVREIRKQIAQIHTTLNQRLQELAKVDKPS